MGTAKNYRIRIDVLFNSGAERRYFASPEVSTLDEVKQGVEMLRNTVQTAYQTNQAGQISLPNTVINISATAEISIYVCDEKKNLIE